MISTKPCAAMLASDLLSTDAIEQELEYLPLWHLNKNGRLIRQFDAKNFQSAMKFLQQVGFTAERQGHHPEIHLTHYKHVELELYTFTVEGVTLEDIKLAEAIDQVPVEYHKEWAMNNKDKIRTPGRRCLAKVYQNQLKLVDENMPGNMRDLESVHSTPYTNTGKLLHAHEFRVHTGHSTLLGHSDIPHRLITSTKDDSGHISYETETEHATEQVLTKPVNHQQHGHVMKSGSFGEEIPKDFETSICVDATVWELMISALTDLMQHGYDTAECETYLPMLEAHSIYPEMEHGLMMFYHHMKSRVTPEWRETEPEQVVTRALQFIRAYETIKNIK